MASTVFATHECPPPRDAYRSRNSSTSSIPWVPRRHASDSSSRRAPSFVSSFIDPPPSGVNFTRASLPAPALPNPNSASTSTSSSEADFSDTPSTSWLSTAGKMSRPLSEPHVRTLPAAVVAQSVRAPPLLRKKSGEPVKSSLKTSGTSSQGSLTIITDPVNLDSSKSAPATLAHKGVHFHSQLEHVKLFIPNQKPLAVSRDGDPTDASGTDLEFSPAIYTRDEDIKGHPLVMHCIDVPKPLSLSEDTRDVAVGSIDLVGTTIEGIVCARNLAFEKMVAVRFTLDKWQTTSEVTARYKDTLQNGAFDRFMFSIKLVDILSWVGKTLYLAVRYLVAGREIWDNNSGQNYQVRFVREKAQNSNKEAVVEGRGFSKGDEIADLQQKLEQVVKLGCPSETIRGILAKESRCRRESPSPTPSPTPRDPTPSFRSEGSLAARYDFAASLRTPWQAPAVLKMPSYAWTNTYPLAQLNFQPLHAPCGSPRDRAESSYFPELDSDGDRDPHGVITLAPTLRRRVSTSSSSRNHTRGGCIDFMDAPGVKCTSPASPFDSPVLFRTFGAETTSASALRPRPFRLAPTTFVAEASAPDTSLV